jgi:PKD repeat protein
MQFPLTTTAPQDLWTEAGGSISRVIMYYDPAITYSLTATPTGPASVNFSNGADSSFVSSWDFGDNSPIATGPTQSHTYAAGGTYNVCTYITNSCGSDTLCTTVTVCGPAPAAANFSFSTAGATASFTDMSSGGSSMLWDFGDGNFSTSANPVHTYAASGTYNVCQRVYNATCDTSVFCTSVTVCIAPTISFTTMWASGGTYDFSGTATEATTYAWDFGDGSPLGSGLNPSHTYALSGTYTVCVTAYGCDSVTTCDVVNICVPAVAGYTYSDVNGTVQFTDTSTNATSWSWDFGDASTDNTQNPSHTYAANGTYNVCLYVGGCVADTICMTVTTCPEALTASFTSMDSLMTAMFMSTSSGSPVTYLWDFGDMTTDSVANPVHTFPSTGLYNVCLTTWNVCGDSATSCDSVLLIITGVNTLPGAEVSIFPNPAQESAVIDVNSAEYAGVFVFEMYDATGKLVRAQNGVIGQRMTIGRDNLAAGTYIYKIRTSEAVISNGKLIFTE